MTERRAGQPLRVYSCMELREILGRRARDEQRLLELIEEAPPDAVYYHTHSYYLRHPYAQGLYPNDFATWVAIHAQDRVLGERLGVIDPFSFDDLEALRGEIVSIMAEHLDHVRVAARHFADEPFELVRSHVIEVDLGVEVATLREFRDALGRVEVGAVYNHLCEARLRQRRPWDDVVHWLSSDGGLGLPALGEQVVNVRRLGLSLEGMRERIVTLCDRALSAAA